ncbi:S-methyl-5-thioribose kinase [Komagataeibacter oboediens]|uniref:S-methyl-5-thioribose kinase n=1 Tax=Komagataeibacter oboediens TaxID=65958 RepID=A0ABS5SLJ0_9PROT|nr:S-methyl-5-thioribose kinase [Komagataeibacter oboediens]MBL7233537.1 S-methyl-5-thioribose kinase [Komagataeibacter oboediens]MBT0675051.1 S-methyl-5-thioribose kinase [Komagataeibacter oboediens]MBT0678412.1 S-methyl-5-thioribose kinase [Komagataeibacter oboediens]
MTQTPYHTLDAQGIRSLIAGLPDVATRLGGAPAQWRVREVSDGNLNNVFLVNGPVGEVCLKQSLPHVRVDPSWKMPLDRTFFEAAWLHAVLPLVGELTTECLYFDRDLYVLIVESLSGHTVLRTALMQGADWPGVAPRIGTFIARAAFGTSLLARPFEEVFTTRRTFAANLALTRITLDLVLDDPYRDHPRNHWHDPVLTPIVLDIRSSAATLLAVENLRRRFLSQPQALLHGDLHTGSIMSTADDTRVIDGEFAIYGPIGFDCGMFVGNLVLHYFATPDRAARKATVRDIAAFWNSFHEQFMGLWNGNESPPPGTLRPLAYGPAAHVAQQAFMDEILGDTIGFAGIEIIRRIIGYAHTADFDTIADPQQRATCRAGALSFAYHVLDHLSEFHAINDFLYYLDEQEFVGL